LKHLFAGFDVTLFAYGVTGTGKTHTMRGGKSLADRGVIPRLLSGIYRRSKKIEKDSAGEKTAEVTMSYYEIYNDRVFDLFEPAEKRTPGGLPLREQHGKTIVVGLTERPCTTLKEFETLYDQANLNRSTSATKLNAHSSRSHAILCVRVTTTSETETKVAMVSAIDLAGAEDNRRTDNGKERLVESASINKSLFVLQSCVDAISKKQNRIPYRESKMTRILQLGQNNGLTIMILNLAPVRSYHLDTLSSLNFANRTKKIEVKEIENEPAFCGPPRMVASLAGTSITRQPLRPLGNISNNTGALPKIGKPKAFAVYQSPKVSSRPPVARKAEPIKSSSDSYAPVSRLIKPARMAGTAPQAALSAAKIEEMVEKKVNEILAAKALDESAKEPVPEISEAVQKRLDMLEQRIEKKDESRSEGLSYLLMAKQHTARGEIASALKMYQLAAPYFPDNQKLAKKMHALQEKLQATRSPRVSAPPVFAATALGSPKGSSKRPKRSHVYDDSADEDYEETAQEGVPLAAGTEYSDDEFHFKLARPRKAQKASTARIPVFRDLAAPATPRGDRRGSSESRGSPPTPRTRHLLKIINTKDLTQIKLLKGVGAKKAEAILECLKELEAQARRYESEDEVEAERFRGVSLVSNLEELAQMRGVGTKTVENMRNSIF
jgi:DNA uptake protein ComE-like DNA-binding protein